MPKRYFGVASFARLCTQFRIICYVNGSTDLFHFLDISSRVNIWQGVSEDLTFEVKRNSLRNFPGGPVVKTPCFHCRGQGFDPWSGD